MTVKDGEIRFENVAYDSLDVHEPIACEKKESNQALNVRKKKRSACLVCAKCCAYSLIIITLILLVLLYLIIPIWFRSSLSFQRSLVFLNHEHFDQLVTPNVKYDLHCVHSFHLNSSDATFIGVWYIPPKSSSLNGTENCPTPSSMSADDRIVVLFAHGSRGSRNSRTNVGHVKLISNGMDAHVVAFDYRGFGDSINVPPFAAGLTDDMQSVYTWIMAQNVTPKRIMIWGHSLGSGVALRYLSRLETIKNPKAAVLETPFTSFREAIPANPLSKFFRFLPYFDYFFVDPIVNNEQLNFDSVSQLSRVRCPLLILHAEDDRVVPYAIGKRLYELALELQPNNVSRAAFVGFERKHGYGHIRLHRNLQLPDIVLNFTRA